MCNMFLYIHLIYCCNVCINSSLLYMNMNNKFQDCSDCRIF